MIDIQSNSSAHMVAQIRSKQLKIKDSQDVLSKSIIEHWESVVDKSGEQLSKEIYSSILEYFEYSQKIDLLIKRKDVNSIGYPIKCNKTTIQLGMAKDWLNERIEKDLISDITQGKLYNELSNDISPQLPILQAPSDKIFWGNENSSVSTVLLASIAATYGIKEKIDGAAIFYPFFSNVYQLDGYLEKYPFVSKHGMTLFGDYQFGGHRYFSNQYPGLEQQIFAPEDCSSAVGKATGLTENQIIGIYTGAIIDAYKNDNNHFGYAPITSSESNINLDRIQTGDIYVKGGHTAIIASKPSVEGYAKCFEFNRDIDSKDSKRMGGGLYQYNLIEKTEKPIYILRSKYSELKESCTLSDFIHRIDENYQLFCNLDQKDTKGDCRIFVNSENFINAEDENNYISNSKMWYWLFGGLTCAAISYSIYNNYFNDNNLVTDCSDQHLMGNSTSATDL